MNKSNWWFKFEHLVWLTDEALSQCSLETQGFWIRCVCVMHKSGSPEITGTVNQVARLLGVFPEELMRCAVDLKETNAADVTLGNGNVTLLSRRLKREITDREQTRLRVQRHRGNASVTLQSKSKSKNKKEEKKETAIAVKKEKPAAAAKSNPAKSDGEWLADLQANAAYQKLSVAAEYARAQVWAETNNRQCTRRFFVNWLNRAKPMDAEPQQGHGNGTHHKSNREKSAERGHNSRAGFQQLLDDANARRNAAGLLRESGLPDPENGKPG